jgi:hypothetical protein
MHRCRRLTRQYEQTPLAHEAMVVISQLMLRRLDRMAEPRHQDGVVRQALGPLGPRCRGGTPSSRPASQAITRITGSDSTRFQPSTASIRPPLAHRRAGPGPVAGFVRPSSSAVATTGPAPTRRPVASAGRTAQRPEVDRG